MFTCAYILFGLGFIAYCLSYFVDKILAKQEEIVVKTIERNTHALMSDDEAHHKIHHLCCFSIRSREDKRLILSSIWLLVLVSVGIIVYDRVDDRTNFIESLYFVTVSISTVGYFSRRIARYNDHKNIFNCMVSTYNIILCQHHKRLHRILFQQDNQATVQINP